MSSRNWASPCGPGCWLRSSPASGSFPSRAAIPDAASRDLATANPIGSSSQVLGSGPLMKARCTPRMRRMETTMSRSNSASYGKQHSLTSFIRTTSRCRTWAGIAARTKDVHFVRHTMLPGKNHPRSRMGCPWFWYGLLRSTRKGFATQACDLFGFACEVTAAAPEQVGPYRAGTVPAARREPFNVAQSHARSEPCL